MTTATNRLRRRRTTAAALRAEHASLEAERSRLAAICEVRSIGGRHDTFRRDGSPLEGIGIDYSGTVTGLPGISHADEAAARLQAIDERLAEIDAAMPAAEEAEQKAQLRAQQEDERRRKQQVRDAIEATRAAVAEEQAAGAAEAEARAALNHDIAASRLGALLSTRQARIQARNAVAHALAGAGGEEAQARVLAELGIDVRRALPGRHPNASPPATAQPQKHDWLIDALLNLRQLQTTVNELSQQIARQSGR
jgi:hypothetical protein